MADGAISEGLGLDRMLVLEVARLTEATAIAAARLRGRGNEMAADQAAIETMHRELARVDFKGEVVVGEGEQDEATQLFVGEVLGAGKDTSVDIAVDPLEGTTICAKAMPNALSVLAISERGGLLRVPEMYMDKIAVGPGYPQGIVDLDKSPAENLKALADAKNVPITRITACVLDRPRHADLIKSVRETGAAIMLIPDGDIAGIIWTTAPRDTCIDIYMGTGGAPEGVLAAAALHCIGGQMQGRLQATNAEQRRRAQSMGFKDLTRKLSLQEMAFGDIIFSATGVTAGALLDGVRFFDKGAETETLVMRSRSGTVRRIRTTVREAAGRHVD
ncbi:MAG: class II fructose-bisphosphatase [Hyphomicrobiaceae bacterium]|nr:class II fructose-bisphosphatase [Hyphomicrobiaceae bacterium]